MAKLTAGSIAAAAPERVLLFCLASDTDWQAAGVTHSTAQHMMVRGMIERHQAATICVDRPGARGDGGVARQRCVSGPTEGLLSSRGGTSSGFYPENGYA